MARNQRLIHATPEAVFEVLADARGYAYWVIGSIEIRNADPGWPDKGTRFHHTVGMGPLRIKDHSVVEAVRPPGFLQLKTRTRPLGNARVKLELEPAGDGATRVTMIEDPADRWTALLFNPLTHLLMRGRNARSLDRLAELAEGRRPMPGDEPGAEVSTLEGEGAVENPARDERARRGLGRAAVISGVGAGACLGLAALVWRRRR